MKQTFCQALTAGLVIVLLAVGFAYQDPVPLILDLRDDLRLTEKQQREIKSVYLRQYRNRRLASAKVTIIDLELEDLIEQEGDLELIRKKLRERADLQANLRFTEIEMERKVNSLLSPEQLKRWQAMNPGGR